MDILGLLFIIAIPENVDVVNVAKNKVPYKPTKNKLNELQSQQKADQQPLRLNFGLPFEPVNVLNVTLVNTAKSKAPYKFTKNKLLELQQQNQQQSQQQTEYQFSKPSDSNSVKGSITVNAKYVGHSSVTPSAEEAIKDTMEQNAPPVNTYYVETAKENEQMQKSDIENIIQIYGDTFQERLQYDKSFDIVNLNIAYLNASVKSAQYFLNKYCPNYIKKLEEWKQKKDEWIEEWYQNQRQDCIDNLDFYQSIGSDKPLLYGVEIDEEQLDMLEKANLAVDGVFVGIVKELGLGINGIADIALAPLDMAKSITSPGARNAIWEGITKDIKDDWNKGTVQGESQAIGRAASFFIPSSGALKGTKLGKAGKTGKVFTKQASGTIGKGVEISTAKGLSKFVAYAQSKIQTLRSKMPNTKLRLKGNMAIAEVDIPGLKKEFTAHSQINSLADKGADLGDFSMLKSSENRIFKSYEPAASKIDGVKFDRFHDTEAKILEDVASQITDPNISGTINLYTELSPCKSCSNIINEFKQKYPNIELNVFHKK